MNAFEYGKWLVKDGWSSKLYLGERTLMEDILHNGQSIGLVDTTLKVNDASVQDLRMGITHGLIVTKARREMLGY